MSRSYLQKCDTMAGTIIILTIIFLLASVAASFGNPLAIKAESASWITWEDGKRIAGLDEFYDQCWEKAKDLKQQKNCLVQQYKRSQDSFNSILERLEYLRMTEEVQIYLDQMLKTFPTIQGYAVEIADDPMMENDKEYIMYATKTVMLTHMARILEYMFTLISGHQ